MDTNWISLKTKITKWIGETKNVLEWWTGLLQWKRMQSPIYCSCTSPLYWHAASLISPWRKFSLIPPGREFSFIPPWREFLTHSTRTRILTHSTRTGNSHSFTPGREFYTANNSPSSDTSQSAPVAEWERRTIHLLRIDMSGSFDNTYPNASQSASVAGWERRMIHLFRIDMSGSSGNTYPDASQSAPVAEWERRTIHLIRILRSRRLSPGGRGERFNFSG